MLTQSAPVRVGAAAPNDARERILAAAYDLFARDGIRAVGIDAIVRESGVARMTLYRHFASKEELVLAWLERREQQWTVGWLQAEIEARASAPAERLLAVFDVFDEWFRRDDFEGCAFVNVVLEVSDPADPVHRAGVERLGVVRSWLAGQARAAGAADPEGLARTLQLLAMGAVVAAAAGDRDAARRAHGTARLVLADALPQSGASNSSAWATRGWPPAS